MQTATDIRQNKDIKIRNKPLLAIEEVKFVPSVCGTTVANVNLLVNSNFDTLEAYLSWFAVLVVVVLLLCVMLLCCDVDVDML